MTGAKCLIMTETALLRNDRAVMFCNNTVVAKQLPRLEQSNVFIKSKWRVTNFRYCSAHQYFTTFV